MSLQDIKELLTDEAKGYVGIHQLRADFSPSLFDKVRDMTPTQAIERGLQGVQTVLQAYNTMGIDVENLSPGHGPGHLARDYLNGYVLLNKSNIDPRQSFIGLVSGSLHDLGCSLVHRNLESTRAIRHAETSALLFLSTQTGFFNPAEKTLIAWAIAAHTHYQKTEEIKCSDGVIRTRECYQDLDDLGSPLLGIWLPRWIDRLDANGPALPARQYLTLGEPYQFMTGGTNYPIEFSDHMTPIIRTPEQIQSAGGKRTMLNHLQSFADSQSNNSVYGKYDSPEYAEMRDEYKISLQRIINSVLHPTNFRQERQHEILNAWNSFLQFNIEPSPATRKNSQVLEDKFDQLEPETRNAWVSGFRTIMSEYLDWSDRMLEKLEDLRREYNSLPGISKNLKRNVIVPNFPTFLLS